MAAKKKVAAPGLCVQGGPDIHPDVVEFVADPGNRAAVDQFIAREAALQASFEAIAAEIDTSMLVTAVAGGSSVAMNCSDRASVRMVCAPRTH